MAAGDEDVELADLVPGAVAGDRRALQRIISIIHPRVLRYACLLYTSPSPRDGLLSRMPSSA